MMAQANMHRVATIQYVSVRTLGVFENYINVDCVKGARQTSSRGPQGLVEIETGNR